MISPIRFLILFSLFPGIWVEFGNNTEQQKIASRPQLENNFGETWGESVITGAVTGHDEHFDDNEVEKLFMQNFKLHKVILLRQRNSNGTQDTVRVLQRKTRFSQNNGFYERMRCLSCYAENGSSTEYRQCLAGTDVEFENCTVYQNCYTELHPLYVRRGCTYSDKLNTTFYCKCPLCNDKPANEPVFYNYPSLRDWQDDNNRLQIRKPIDMTICKLCQTHGDGINTLCESGQVIDNMYCGDNYVCFTKIDGEKGQVSRGCAQRPRFNSIHFYCNKNACNNDSFAMLYKEPVVVRLTKQENVKPLNSVHYFNVDSILLFMGIFTSLIKL